MTVSSCWRSASPACWTCFISERGYVAWGRSVLAQAYFSSARPLHRPHVEIRHLGRARQGEGAHHGGGDVRGLKEALGVVGLPLVAVHLLLHGGGGAAGEDGEDADPLRVDLVAQAVGEGAQGVL